MEYFIRFVGKEEYAESDRERGHSFREYIFFPKADEAVEWAEDMGWDTEEITPFEMDGEVVYGFATAGLCGFGPFETAEEAEESAIERGGYNGVAWPIAAIFTGSYIGQADSQDGDMFRPKSIVKIVNL